MTVTETVTAITAAAATHDASERMVRTIEVGQHVRQGDLYVRRVLVEPAHGGALATRQLAPGETRGSRHTATAPAECYAPLAPGPLTGPVVVSPERWVLEHPEHADISMPSGIYQITYQRDWEAEEIRRVAD